MQDRDDDRARIEAAAGERLALLIESFHRLTGGTLAVRADALWDAPRIILAHGVQADPIFFYANHMALDLFALDAAALLAMPSRLSAEPMHRDERAAFLATVGRQGFIDDYAGVRISSTGQRFRIEQATVWNLADASGRVHGQAATFDRWVML